MMDCYGNTLTTNPPAGEFYRLGLEKVLRLTSGALDAFSASVVADPGFALGHAALALLGFEFGAAVDVTKCAHAARLAAVSASAYERSQVHAVLAHIRGDSDPLLKHLGAYPRDALLLSTAVPTIAFRGVTAVPEETWELMDRVAPAYGDDWWFIGLMTFVRQEQGVTTKPWNYPCDRSRSSPARAIPRMHERTPTTKPLTTTQAWPGWTVGCMTKAPLLTASGTSPGTQPSMNCLWVILMQSVGGTKQNCSRLPTLGGRTLIDTGSLLWRWALTPGAQDVPNLHEVVTAVGRDSLVAPRSPFLALHAAIVLLAVDDAAGLRQLGHFARSSSDPTTRQVIAPLADALQRLQKGEYSAGADALGRLALASRRLGGSDAQREILEETRIGALLKADRFLEAQALIDARLDRRVCRRDLDWRHSASADVHDEPSPSSE